MLRKVTTYQPKISAESLVKSLSTGCFYEVQTVNKQGVICVYDVDFASLQKFLGICPNIVYSVKKKVPTRAIQMCERSAKKMSSVLSRRAHGLFH